MAGSLVSHFHICRPTHILMHFVLFVGQVPAEKRTESEKFYRHLQPILHHKVEGFIDETGFINPSQPETQLLFARFANEDAIAQWRNNSTHLMIMHHARHGIFSHFRVTVCTDNHEPSTTAEKTERVVLVHERQHNGNLEPEQMQPALKAGYTSEALIDSEYYVGETHSLRIWRLNAGTNAKEFEESLEHLSTDHVYRLQVARDYSNSNRTEAPSGIYDAETAASG